MRKPTLNRKRAKALLDVMSDTALTCSSYKITDPRHDAVEYLHDLIRWKLGKTSYYRLKSNTSTHGRADEPLHAA